MNKHTQTFCPLPFMNISSGTSGIGIVCCKGDVPVLSGKSVTWKETDGLHSYFNSEGYKKLRFEMLRGGKPSHCRQCFKQEEAGVRSIRKQLNEELSDHIDSLIEGTRSDGHIDDPQILQIEMAFGNTCNLRCRMCNPWASFLVAKDWQKIGRTFDYNYFKKLNQSAWHLSPKSLNLIKQALPTVQKIMIAGGEPMILEGHRQILRMIIDEGHAHRIHLRYHSNQTVIPKELVKLWEQFKEVVFFCSIEANGILNDYIRYPSRWERLEQNIHMLDEIAGQQKNFVIRICSTFQVYNVPRIPEFLDYLRYAGFKNICRFPHFSWVTGPRWCSPTVFPSPFKEDMADRILKKIDEHEKFFLSYNERHRDITVEMIQTLRELTHMMKSEPSLEKGIDEFVQETKKFDRVQNQSIANILPEMSQFF